MLDVYLGVECVYDVAVGSNRSIFESSEGCGGLYRVSISALTQLTSRAPGKVVYSKWYRNSEHNTFTDVFKTFLQEAKAEGADVKVDECGG